MSDEYFSLYDGFIIGMIVAAIVFAVFSIAVSWNDIPIDQDTANTICQKLTGNETEFNAYSENGKLICELPSYDHTQNVIIKSNGERE